jgi:dTDP-4-amino-4,6-dideoxygalactose transaminase
VGVASGTDALLLALLSGGIQGGDEVLLPSFAPGAVAVAVRACGAVPVFADVTAEGTLDFQQLPGLLGPRTRALIVVHLYGKAAPLEHLLPWAEAHRLWVVEDCAHAHGAFHAPGNASPRIRAGLRGDAGAFSFYPTKNLAGIGDGGFCASKHLRLGDKLRSLRQYGWSARDCAAGPGRNSRLDEIQAAALRVGLSALDERNARRRALATRYVGALTGRTPKEFALPGQGEVSASVFHQFVVRTPRRTALMQHLERSGIGCGIHYPLALHQQPAFAPFAQGRSFPESERQASTVLSLPLFPELRDEDCDRICEEIIRFWNSA